MPLPSPFAGTGITADAGTYMLPLEALKIADQSVTLSTVLVNDTALFLGVAANQTYKFTMYVDYEGGTQGSADMKWAFTVPAGAALRYTAWGTTTAGGVIGGSTFTDASTGLAAGTATAGVLKGLVMFGTLTVAGTAGNIQYQWAQNTSSGTATIIHAASWMRLDRMA